MTKKPIELEIRGEIKAKEIPAIEKRLKERGFKHLSTTRRTSVMSFGAVREYLPGGSFGASDLVDIRCRVTSGKAEVVTKIGKNVVNRHEVSHPVPLEDMIGFTRVVGAMPFFTKVGSKITINYQKGPVVISLVTSPSGLAYIEIEKMTDRTHEMRDHAELVQLAKDLHVTIWKTHKQFITFCDLLTKRDDWTFRGTPADVKRLKQEMKKTRSDRK